MENFKKLFENELSEAKLDLLDAAIVKAIDSEAKGKVTSKKDGNALVVTVKETEPNESWGKINETAIMRSINDTFDDFKYNIGSREMDGSGVYSSTNIENGLGDYSRVSYSMKNTKKYRTTTIRFV